MKNPKKPFQWLQALLALLILQSNVLASNAVGAEDGWEYSYDPGSPLGPENWGHLHDEWAQCANGELQTPISINASNVLPDTSLRILITHYVERPAFLHNNGHGIMVTWTESPGHLQIGRKKFHLQQCHWHSPSEHELYGKRYPLELHMVHTTPQGEMAVIAVLYQFGAHADRLLNTLRQGLNELLTQNDVKVGSIHPPAIDKKNYFRYIGSLTSPPCSEPVIWTLMEEVKSVRENQVDFLRSLVHQDNARPVQPNNGRVIFMYEEHHGDHENS